MEENLKLTQKISGRQPIDLWGCLLSGEFIKNDKKIVKYFGYNNRIVCSLDGKHIHKILNLSFDTKFTYLRHPLQNSQVVGHPRGIMLEDENCQDTITLLSEDMGLLKLWKEYLSARINQRGFHQEFKAHRRIGRGNFASVYLADRLEDQRSFAIKAFSKEGAYSEKRGKESIINEIQVMRQLNSHALIKLHEVYETENSLYMVLDLLEGGSLYDMIKVRPTLNLKEIETIMRALIEGCAHMHEKRIMHRDLKPENILFRKQGNLESVCIADFGLATNADEEQYIFIRCGTPGFVAPEVVNCQDENVHYEPVCDVFSLGLIFYVLLTGKPAFPGKDYKDVLQKNRDCHIQFEGSHFNNVPKACINLLKQMLEKNPSKRKTAAEILRHPYFQQGNVDDGTVESEDENGSLGEQLSKLKDDQVRFDMARLKQLQQTPNHSPIITGASKLAKNVIDPTFVMNQPILSGKVDSVQNSPSGGIESPGLIKHQVLIQKPSRFKQPFNDENDKDKQEQYKLIQNPKTNPLYKYALMNKVKEDHKLRTK